MAVTVCLLAHDQDDRLDPVELNAALEEFDGAAGVLSFREFEPPDYDGHYYALFPQANMLSEVVLIRVHEICRLLEEDTEEAQDHPLYDYYDNLGKYEVLRDVPDTLFAESI